MIVACAFRLHRLKLAVGLSLALAMFCQEAQGLPRAEALRSGAARYEASLWSVSAADEAFLFTPAGFTKPGKTVTATGQDVGHLRIRVRDKVSGKPTFCRMNVVGADGNYYQPKENKLASYSLTANAWTERVGRLPRANRPGVPPVRYLGRFFYCSGEITVDVPAGPVRVEVWKGFEYRPIILETRVTAGSSQSADLTLERTLPMCTEHYYSGDPHLHFPRQTPADDELVLDMMEADDIHFGSILAYNDPPGPYPGVMSELVAPQTRGLGTKSLRSRGDYHILSGQEYRSTTYGHVNLYMQDGIVLPDQQTNADDWPLYGDLGKELQSIGGYTFYAHGGYAQSIYADFVQGGINGVELLQFSVYRGIGLDDWYHMLNCGYRFPALGASDYPWCRLLGDNKTFVHIEGDEDFAKWLKGAAEGRSFVTSGPMLLLEVHDEAGMFAKPGDQISRDGKGPHRITVRVRVRSEVAPVTNMQIIVNGEVVEEMVTPVDQGTGRWITLERPLDLSEPSWIAARAFSKASTGAPNAEAHTNPVYFYLDGKAPYRQASVERMVEGIDRQIAFTKQRDFEKKNEVVAYFERSRDILLKIRAGGGATSDGQPIAVQNEAPDKAEKASAADHALDDLKELLKPLPAKTAEEALKTFEVADGFHLEVVAKEPLVYDPIAAAFDENGQLYVCEDRDYPYRPKPGERPLSAIRILRDTNGDGVFDASHVFADGLLWASGVVPWKGGVFVAAAPDIWYLKDTDGDFKADVRIKVFTGFGTQNQQAMLNNLAFGPDHKIYGSTAGNGGTVHSGDCPNDKGVSVSGHDFRFDPVNRQLETVTGTVQFGNSFDDWGNRFMCSQSSPLLHAVLPEQYLARNPYLPVSTAVDNLAGSPVPIFRISPVEGWRQIRSDRRIAQERPATADGVSHHVVDAAAGVTVYRGAAYGDKYYGNVFVCDAENNLIHRRTLTPSGATFESKRADENTEFVRSSDNWFRPVNLVNAPDGTLYILDMSREIIESVHIPSDIVKYLDLTNGRNQGRIYRLTPPMFQFTVPPRLGEASTADLVRSLERPSCWQRDTAHRLIFERQDQSCVPALRALVKNGFLPQARMLALWSLQGLGALTDDDLEAALADESAEVLCHAIRLAEPRLDDAPGLFTNVLSHADDSSERVCFQLAFSLGETKDPRAVSALVRIAEKYAADPWIRTAILSSSAEIADKLLLELLERPDFFGTHEGKFLLSQLAQVVGARRHAAEIGRVIEALGERDDGATASIPCEDTLLGLGNGLKQFGARLPTTKSLTKSGANLLSSITDRAMQSALNSDAKNVDRLEAIAFLGCLDFETVRAPLAKLLGPAERQSVQLAALDALGGYGNAEIAGLVLAGWPHYTPALRTRAIQLMLSRDVWSQAYLSAIQDGQTSIAEIDFAERTQLLKHRNESIRSAAKKLFVESPRSTVIAEYRSVLHKHGDPSRGNLIFQRECAACHRLGGSGTAIGPDLTSSASRDGDALLANILDPNRYVPPNYLQFTATDNSGRTVSGLLTAETATSITLTRGQGASETLLRTNIDELVSTGQSLMSEGFEQRISKTEMCDLIAFLSDSIESNPASNRPAPDIGTLPGLTEPDVAP